MATSDLHLGKRRKVHHVCGHYLIDDPLDPDKVRSETQGAAVNAWFTDTLLSRLDDKGSRRMIRA